MAGKKQITEKARIKLKIVEEKLLGRSAFAVFNLEKDLIDQIKECIQEELEIGITNRADNSKKSTIGINAVTLNLALRNAMSKIDGIHFETSVENGAFFERKTKSNFDFSYYNRMLNYAKFWNYGRNHADFDKKISQSITSEFVESWEEFLNTYRPKRDEDIDTGITDYTVIGEIQFGNWAMIYKDIIRLLRAKNSPGVELYIYITDTGDLNKFLSSKVVEYKKALRELQENMDIIQTPILIIGLDVDMYDDKEFREAHEKVMNMKKKVARNRKKI